VQREASPDRQCSLAPTYPASAVTDPFPFNAFYPVDDAPEIDGDDYALGVRPCRR
jgi:hypothetical protein